MFKLQLERLCVLFGIVMMMTVTMIYSQPGTFEIQGQLTKGDGSSLSGSRVYSIKFFDAATAGNQLGPDLVGTVMVASSGRFSIEISPPVIALTQSVLFYELGLDSADTPDGLVDATDIFASRVQVHSVMFALQATNALTANSAVDSAALSGKGSNEFYQVGGNTGLTSPALIGTSDNVALRIGVNNKPAIEIQPDARSNNILVNPEFNTISSEVEGGAILSGGVVSAPNSVTNDFAVIVGGGSNIASGEFSVISGGLQNTASGERASIGGGLGNTADGISCHVGGGGGNTASGVAAAVAGGSNNLAVGFYAFVGGGESNIANQIGAFVGGGVANNASGMRSFIGCGVGNIARDVDSVVVGGNANNAYGEFLCW